jgi:hypothetical protein
MTFMFGAGSGTIFFSSFSSTPRETNWPQSIDRQIDEEETMMKDSNLDVVAI